MRLPRRRNELRFAALGMYDHSVIHALTFGTNGTVVDWRSSVLAGSKHLESEDILMSTGRGFSTTGRRPIGLPWIEEAAANLRG